METPNKKNIFKRFFLTRFFENLYYILYAHLMLVLSILGIGLSVAIILFVLEWLFPKDVHIFNYILTDKTVKELYQNHNYHAAIFVAENDTSYINDKPSNIPNKLLLRDCYFHVGEYSKAEKIDNYFLISNFDSFKINKPTCEDSLSIRVLHAYAARNLFRLYEKMGDKYNGEKMYHLLKKEYQNIDFDAVNRLAKKYAEDLPFIKEDYAELFSLKYDLKYDLICGLYLSNPEKAIDSLYTYIDRVWAEPKYKGSSKIKLINKLLSWHLERNDIFKAQEILIKAIDAAKRINREEDMEPIGDFAEYCYILHDYKNARRFMNVYMRFMGKYYGKEDLEYLMAEARNLKYQDVNINKKISDITHCCRGLRNQISKNFVGLTASQQEYFALKLKEPFDYALHLLADNPHNDDLIELCFENEIFNRGLLLRSDAQLRSALSNTNDSSLIKDYNSYLTKKEELIAREDIPGAGNAVKKLMLQRDIEKLEKRLAQSCLDFDKNNDSEINVSDIKRALTKTECLVVYSEIPQGRGKGLGAFVLSKRNGLSYVPLCSSEALAVLEKSDVLDLCVKESTYKKLFEQLVQQFPATKEDNIKVLYSPAGVINRIPLAALSIDSTNNSTKTLADNYSLTLIANPIDLTNREESNDIDLPKSYIALWGGIEYGSSLTSDSMLIKTRSIIRGKDLEYLPASKIEVEEISDSLGRKVKKVKMFVGYTATEKSFKNESKYADIIHISTHGFFNDDKTHGKSNAMHNAGLFFANANRAWKDDYIPKSYTETYGDGILRAEEIENLNMLSCKLVVLSACETGLGEIKGNEGVYGLQRAFKLAGARFILMSLWSVPDAATKDLMTEFYKNLLTEKDIDLAFSNAQKSMRENRTRRYGIQDWGGFVLLH